ncbi:E3 ubiquitin-protein ligase rnf213-alpha-like [Amphiura filiformis]|uniref:E3 ubiquitin-protein ligase rnf213-alpha-like n=1 Tax=Amphiura filiformis TaxID=82378 RepID=UPI003B21142D
MASNQGNQCQRCRTQLIPGAPFCPGCGLPTTHNQDMASTQCQRCRAQLISGALFCPMCGLHAGYPYQPQPFVPNQGFYIPPQQQGGYYHYPYPGQPIIPQQAQYLMDPNVRFQQPQSGSQFQPVSPSPQQNITITEVPSLEYSDTFASGNLNQPEQGIQANMQNQNSTVPTCHQMNANSQDPGIGENKPSNQNDDDNSVCDKPQSNDCCKVDLKKNTTQENTAKVQQELLPKSHSNTQPGMNQGIVNQEINSDQNVCSQLVESVQQPVPLEINNNIEHTDGLRPNDPKSEEDQQNKIPGGNLQQDSTPENIQQEGSVDVHKNEQIHMEQKQISEQCGGHKKTGNQSPQHGAEFESLPEYKPVFGQQAHPDSHIKFASEAFARHNEVSTETKTTSSQSVDDVGKLAGTVVTNVSTGQAESIDHKGNDQNGHISNVTMETRPERQNGGSYDKEQDQSPPIPLPGQEKHNEHRGNGSKEDGPGDSASSAVTKEAGSDNKSTGEERVDNSGSSGYQSQETSGKDEKKRQPDLATEHTVQDENPPIPLPHKKTRKDVEDSSGKEGDGKSSQIENANQVDPGTTGDVRQMEKNMKSESKQETSKASKGASNDEHKGNGCKEDGPGDSANSAVIREVESADKSTGEEKVDKIGSSGYPLQGPSGKVEKKRLLDLAKEHTVQGGNSKHTYETKGHDAETDKNDNQSNEPAVYNKDQNKNKGKENNKGPTQAADGLYIPLALMVEQGQCLLLHFHTIVAPEFNYNPKQDKAVVVMDGVDFGKWTYHCVELKKEKDLQNGYIQISGSAHFQISSLKGKKIQYKYQICKDDITMWEFIYKPGHGIWNHILAVPDHQCVNGANWHQYDDVVHYEIKDHQNQNTRVWKRALTQVASTLGFSNPVSQLVHDRQLAAQTFLPKWEGFVMTQTPANMEAVEAIGMVEQVCRCVMHPQVAHNNSNQTSKWEPSGFNAADFLLKYLSNKINSFNQGSDVDVIAGVEKRLISALAISKVIHHHQLRPSKQLWNNLFKGLRLPSNLQKPEYTKLAKNIRETYNIVLQEMIDVIEALCNSAIKEGKVKNFLFTLPLLHLLRQDIRPYEPAHGNDYLNEQWWGVNGLNIDHHIYERQNSEIGRVHSQLLPMFDVDCLLERTILRLHLTPSGLLHYMETKNTLMETHGTRTSPKLISCALHILLTHQFKSHDDIKKLHKCMDILQPQLSAINQSDGITMTATDCVELVTILQNITLTTMDRLHDPEYAPLIARSCELFAASHSACTAANITGMTTRSNSEMQKDIHQQAHKVLKTLIKWLDKTLPGIAMSFDGKQLHYTDEMNVWHQLLGIACIFKTDFGEMWKNQLIGFLHQRIEKLNDTGKVQLFSNFDRPNLQVDVSNCLSDAAFDAIDILVNDTKAKGTWDHLLSSSSSAPFKCGHLLSKVLLKSWPESEDDQSLLEHLLTWAPFPKFYKITSDQKTAYGNILTEEAQYKLALAKSVFEATYESVFDGSIIIGRLKLIIKYKCCNQFVALSNQIAAMNKGKDAKESPHNVETDIIRLIDARRNELKTIEEQYILNDCLVKMCRKIDPVDYAQVEQNLHANMNELELCEVCHPATCQSLQMVPRETLPDPDVHFFQHQPYITEMLQPLFEIQDSPVFIKLWRKQAAKLRKVEESEVLSLSDVATKVWHPVHDIQLKEISAKLTNAQITFAYVDMYFKDLIENEADLQDELRRLMSLQGDVDDGIIEGRLGQIKDYFHYKHQSSAAGEMLNIKDAFELTGDFVPIKTLAEVTSESVKKQPLQAINQDVDHAAREMQGVNKDQIQCLKQLAKCRELINWIRREIKDERQLRVFVELAMNSAGETAMDIDKVTCFHRAVTGYASFIFDLKSDAGYKELLAISKKVWIALEKDENLSDELIDTQKELYWFRNVRNSQGDVETSSLMLAATINRRGIYTIGKLEPEKGCTEAPVLLLKVTAPDDDEPNKNTDEKKKQTYTIDELKDLQSKLTLVASKKRQEREGQSKVDHFVEVFTAAQQLAAMYKKLTQAGNILFSEWKAYLYCHGEDQDQPSVHIEFGGGKKSVLTGTRALLVELNCLRRFMNECLQEWYQYVSERRSDCYHLNYFTTEQLVLLRRHLASFAISDDDDELPPAQVFVLLSAVTARYDADDVRNALKKASKDIEKSLSGEEGVDEHQEAERKEKALKIVQELNEEYGIEKKVAWAVIQDIGLDESIDKYTDWCVHHGDDNDKVNRLFSELNLSEPYLLQDEDLMAADDDDTVNFKRIPSMTRKHDEVTHSLLASVTSQRKTLREQLTDLWKKYLDSMKGFDVEDCLSLEHLGLVLRHLAEGNADHTERSFPSPLEEGVPNLVVRSSGDVLMNVISLYMQDGGKLPSFEEVLVCSPDTSLEEIVLLWRRAIGDQLGRVFCLVRADLLNYDISVNAEKELGKLMKGQTGYRLVIVCSSDKEDSSYIMTALDQYRREMPASSSRDCIQQYLKEQFKMQADVVQYEGVETAASLTTHGCNVEVIMSSRPGVGKTLKVKRYREQLCQDTIFDEETDACVTIPLQEAAVDKDAIVSALLPHQDESISSQPRIYHLDVAPMVHKGLDHLLFNLLILKGLSDSHGQVWSCKPQDLYVVEITDFALRNRNKNASRNLGSLPFYSILPCVTCRVPQEVLSACQWEEEHGTLPHGWQDCDPKVDDEEFRGAAFQRAYQYLVRHSQRSDLDAFIFKENTEGDDKSFLTTLLNHCGIEDPSWSELRHFAHFLSIQLEDCQSSVFCNPDYHDLESGFWGFKTFVVKFMIKMAMDFATPSLNMSEENPSCAIETKTSGEESDEDDLPQELEAFQLRRRWETSLHPYIFFNHDHESMTFMGFYIDHDGSLRDPSTQNVIEANIMNRILRQALHVNGVELSKDFDNLPRWKKLQQLGRVLAVKEIRDTDETYELTTDNVKKILAIHMRFRCGIPVVIMGETGCGKTRLIRFLCRLQAGLGAEDGLKNMILMKASHINM